MGADTDLDGRRKRELAIIHIGKKQLGLDDDAYRIMLKMIGGVASAADLDGGGRHKVIEHLKRCGVRLPRRRDRDPVAGVKAKLRPKAGQSRQEALIFELWDALKARGALRNRDASLETFMHRMGIAATHPRFLGPIEANKVIEGLKDWLRRAARTEAQG